MRFFVLFIFITVESYINLNQYFSNSGQTDVKVDEELSEKGKGLSYYVLNLKK